MHNANITDNSSTLLFLSPATAVEIRTRPPIMRTLNSAYTRERWKTVLEFAYVACVHEWSIAIKRYKGHMFPKDKRNNNAVYPRTFTEEVPTRNECRFTECDLLTNIDINLFLSYWNSVINRSSRDIIDPNQPTIISLYY